MLSIDPWIYPLLALLLLIVPFPWLFSAIIAAIVHETAHICTIMILGKQIRKLHISISGTTIHTVIMEPWQELLCALAGPLGSAALLLMINIFPRLALCAGVQGIFNLIPLYPLDGGRILHCLLTILLPENANKVYRYFQNIIIIFFVIAALYGTFLLNLGLTPAIFVLVLLCSQKKLANRQESGYNSNTIENEVSV